MRTLAALLLLSSCTISSGSPSIPELAVGARAEFSDADYVIVSAVDRGPTLPTRDGGDSVTSTGRYVDVHFTVKNKTNAPSTTMFAPLMVDGAGHTYSALAVGISKFYVDKGALEYRWHDLAPGEELAFQEIYDITDPAAKDLHLELHGAEPDDVRLVPLGL